MKSLKKLMDLNGRVSLITGGAGHIGYAICEALAELGSLLIILDNNEEGSIKAKSSLEEKYNTYVEVYIEDISSEKMLRDIPSKIESDFGRLDILINNAAFAGDSKLDGWVTAFEDQSVESWNKALNVNLTSVFTLTQVCTNLLKQNECGSVVNVASTYGVVGPDLRLYEDTKMGNPAAYAASKGGLIQLTRWMSTVLAPEVRVNAISPGGVYRNQPSLFVEKYISKTPLKRMATEEDFKGAIAYLSSDLSKYVTGHNLVVDGGWVVW